MIETTTDQRPYPSGSSNSVKTPVHSRRHRRRTGRKRTIALFLSLGALLLLAILVVYLFSAITRYNIELTAQRAALESTEADLRRANAALKKIRGELDALLQQRLPNLKPLRFDQVIRIKQPYIRNVLFSGASTDDRRDYKFTIILENIDLPPAVLTVRILLFDRSGVQIGGATLDNIGMLRPGEQQTLSGDAHLFMAATPEYFHIDSSKD